MRRASSPVLAALGLVIGASCQLTFDDDLVYVCSTDAECGGGGYRCVSGICCLDGVCAATTLSELDCRDGADEDDDGAFDCADPDCADQTCGEGCTCLASARHETGCFDRADNDGNGEIDCEDLSCAGRLCLEGTTRRCWRGECLCNGGATASEDGISCGDGLDNDCDGLTDCFEPSCAGLSCGHDGSADCTCVGTRKAERSCTNGADDDGDGFVDCADLLDCPEASACTGTLGSVSRPGECSSTGHCVAEFCFDRADDDGDGLSDCADPDCSEVSCSSDGGPGCVCVNGLATEANCGDGLDNDGDGLRDCADEVDCPAGSSCLKLSNGQAGFCQAANKTCN